MISIPSEFWLYTGIMWALENPMSSMEPMSSIEPRETLQALRSLWSSVRLRTPRALWMYDFYRHFGAYDTYGTFRTPIRLLWSASWPVGEWASRMYPTSKQALCLCACPMNLVQPCVWALRPSWGDMPIIYLSILWDPSWGIENCEPYLMRSCVAVTK